MAATCKGEWGPLGRRQKCAFPPTHGEYCILHSPDPNKGDLFRLAQDMDRLLNYCGTQFMVAESLRQKSFTGGAVFDYSEFHAEVKFEDVAFGNNTSFRCVVFHKAVRFSLPCRLGNVDFSGAVFRSGVSFMHTNFNGEAVFRNVVFGRDGETTFVMPSPHTSLRMERCTFAGKSVIELNAGHSGNLVLENCDLSGLRMIVDGDWQQKLQFVGSTWPSRYKKWLGFGLNRLMVADELDGREDNRESSKLPPAETSSNPSDKKSGPDTRVLVRVYNRLYDYYFSRSEYDLADEFYISAQALRRQSEKRGRLSRVVSWLYQLLFRYGFSISRPLTVLIAMWFAIPGLLLYLGVQLNGDTGLTQYAISDGIFLPFTTDYWRTAALNFQLSTIVRSSDLRPAVTSWQGVILAVETFLNVLFATFLGLGIKKLFSPKRMIQD